MNTHFVHAFPSAMTYFSDHSNMLRIIAFILSTMIPDWIYLFCRARSFGIWEIYS